MSVEYLHLIPNGPLRDVTAGDRFVLVLLLKTKESITRTWKV